MKPLFPTQESKYLVIDFANLVWRTSVVKTRTMFAKADGTPTGHLFLFLRSLVALRKQYPNHTLLFALEGSSANRRKLFPEYKAQRERTEGFDPFPDVLRLLPLMHCGVAQNVNYEADDVIASVVVNFDDCVVVSTDKDMWQLVDRATVINGSKGQVTSADLEKEFDCPVNSIALYKAIYGDTSDNIPAIKGLRWNQVRPLLAKCITPQELVTLIESKQERTASEEKLYENREQIASMWNITKLNIVDYELTMFSGCKEELYALLTEFECFSLLSEVERLT